MNEYIDLEYECMYTGVPMPLRVYGVIEDGEFCAYEVKVLYVDHHHMECHEVCDISESLKEDIYIDICTKAEYQWMISNNSTRDDYLIDKAMNHD